MKVVRLMQFPWVMRQACSSAAQVNSADLTVALLSPMATAGPIIAAPVDSADSNLVLLSPKILNVNSVMATAGPVDMTNKDQRGMQLCAHFNCNDPFLA
jgi:hypothetical protein